MLLTMFVEIGYIISTGATLISSTFKADYPLVLNIEQVLFQLQLVNIACALYFMLEHNIIGYYRVLRIFELCNICCCLKSLIVDMNQTVADTEIVVDDMCKKRKDSNLNIT